jgi:hypothetical protein
MLVTSGTFVPLFVNFEKKSELNNFDTLIMFQFFSFPCFIVLFTKHYQKMNNFSSIYEKFGLDTFILETFLCFLLFWLF